MLTKLLVTGTILATIGSGSIALANTNSTSTSSNSTTLAPTTTQNSGHFGHPRGRQFDLFRNAASVLGISQQTLITDLQSGKSLTDIASSKKISKSTLVTKLLADEQTELDKQVKAGQLTSVEETKRLAKLKTELSGQVDQKGFLPKKRGGFGGRHGAGFDLIQNAATVLGMDQPTLMTDLQSGKSLTEIAATKNINKTTLVTKLLTAEKADLDSQVKAGQLTSAEETKKLSEEKTELSSQVDQKGFLQRKAGRPGMRGGNLLQAGATVLGISEQTLVADLQSGKSLTEIAATKNINKPTLITKLLAEEKTQLDSLVKAGQLTSTEETQLLTQEKSELQTQVDQKGFPKHGPGGREWNKESSSSSAPSTTTSSQLSTNTQSNNL